MKRFIERFKQDPFMGILFLLAILALIVAAVDFVCYCIYWNTPLEEVPGVIRFMLGWINKR